jgi:hypothetical protein
MSLDLNRFIAGAAGEYMRQDQARVQDEQELKKLRFVEQLRRETSDYEFKRETERQDKTMDVRNSYADYARGVYVMVNGQGKPIGERPLTKTEVQQGVLNDLEVEGKQQDLVEQKKRISLMGRETGGYGGGGGRGALDGSSRDPGKLHSMLNAMTNNLRKYGIPEDVLIDFEAEGKKRIMSGAKGFDSIAGLRYYETVFLNDPAIRMRVAEAAKARQQRSAPKPPTSATDTAAVRAALEGSTKSPFGNN